MNGMNDEISVPDPEESGKLPSLKDAFKETAATAPEQKPEPEKEESEVKKNRTNLKSVKLDIKKLLADGEKIILQKINEIFSKIDTSKPATFDELKEYVQAMKVYSEISLVQEWTERMRKIIETNPKNIKHLTPPGMSGSGMLNKTKGMAEKVMKEQEDDKRTGAAAAKADLDKLYSIVDIEGSQAAVEKE